MDGVIPALSVTGNSLAEAWERSLIALWELGREIRTEYDRKDNDGNFIDPPSRDCRMMFTVLHPDSEPRFHRCFPGGPADLQEYRMEVVDGIKDHWMDEPDPNGTKWSYTYHDRLRRYRFENQGRGPMRLRIAGAPIDQIQKMIEHLARSPYTRRCQAITWQPWRDMDAGDPPCLQRIWCRIMFDDDGDWWLNMDVDFRSRDAYKAAFMNADAFVYLMQYMADEIGKIAGRRVHLGHYCDTSNSYHIYGKDIAMFKREFLDNFKKRSFEDRTYTSDVLLPMMLEAIPEIEEKVRSKGC
jgi:thymidylate synthase